MKPLKVGDSFTCPSNSVLMYSSSSGSFSKRFEQTHPFEVIKINDKSVSLKPLSPVKGMTNPYHTFRMPITKWATEWTINIVRKPKNK